MKNILISIVVLAVIGFGGWMIFKDKETMDDQVNLPVAELPVATPALVVSNKITIHYTSTGFTPKSTSIKVGDSVTWVNETTHGMWVASANHPSHAVYDGTSLTQHCASPTATTFDQCQSSQSYTFVFTKTGSWNYHDHVTSGNFGTVIVTK